MDTNGVQAAVEELARVIRADGGDLLLVAADDRRACITLRLELDGVTCADCVLPPDALYETVRQSLARSVPEEFELVIDDPRRTAPPR